MQIVISDSAILSNIDKAALTSAVFMLPYEFVVCDLLFEAELSDWIGPELLAHGLRVEELGSSEILHATRLKRRNGVLSTPDAFAISLARAQSWPLVAGNRALFLEAITHGVSTYDILWIFDELDRQEICDPEMLRSCMHALQPQILCRHAAHEFSMRLSGHHGGTN